MNLFAVATMVVLHLATQPPRAVQVRAEVSCGGELVATASGTAPGDLHLPVPCDAARVTVSADGFVPAELTVAANDGRRDVVLEEYARFVPPAKAAGSAAWWRPVGRAAQRLDPAEAETLRVVPSSGCLAVVAGAAPPVLRPLELEPGAEVRIPRSSGGAGLRVCGAVVGRQGHAVTAQVVARRGTKKRAPTDPAVAACRALGDELGLTATRTGVSGAFELGPLAASAWTLLFTAEGYAPREVLAVPGKKGTEVDVGEVRLEAIGALRIVLDAEDCPVGPPYRLQVDRENPDWVSGSNRWRRQASRETDAAEPVVLANIPPGSYRVRVDKPGTPLAAVEFVEVTPGEERAWWSTCSRSAFRGW